MTRFEAIEVVAHLHVWHSHHALHQVLSVGVKALASLQWFGQ